MQYKNIISGIFLSRPNRFLAQVLINEKVEMAHVKNTGRCKEILIPGTRVYLERSAKNNQRKTQFSLISAHKNSQLINIDSQIPNVLIADALQHRNLLNLKPFLKLKREVSYCRSRFDLMYQNEFQKGFIEVKGVTLENNGICQFPDAPTTRGTRHIRELIKSAQEGYDNYILFVIQMKGVKYFCPNDSMDPLFGVSLRNAQSSNVRIEAYDCLVGKDYIKIDQPVKIIL